MRSAPLTVMTGPSFLSMSMLMILADDSPSSFGRKGERDAKTPILLLPPSRGGRTVSPHWPSLPENPQIIHRYSNPSSPRTASSLANSGVKTIFPSNSSSIPLWRGIPNLEVNGDLKYATGVICVIFSIRVGLQAQIYGKLLVNSRSNLFSSYEH